MEEFPEYFLGSVIFQLKYVNTKLLSSSNLKGFASFLDPKALPQPFEHQLSNARLSSGLPQARWGDVEKASISDGEFQGLTEGHVDTGQQLFRSKVVEGKILTEISIDEGSTWSNITPLTGPFGDTSFDSVGGDPPLQYCIVHDQSFLGNHAHDVLLIQNGVEPPRIYAASSGLSSAFHPAGTFGMAKVIQPSAPSSVQTNPILLYSLDVAEGSPSFLNEDGISSAQEGTSNPHHYFSISIDSDYVSGNTSTWSVAPFSIDGGSGGTRNQLVFVGYSPNSSGTRFFWQQMKVEIDDGTGAWVTIYDPSTSSNSVFIEIATEGDRADENWVQFGFSLAGVALSQIRKLRFSWYGEASPLSGYIAALAAGGRLRGGARAGVAFFASDSRSLGPGVVGNNIGDLSVFQVGGGSQFNDVKLVEDPRFFFDYSVSFANPPRHRARWWSGLRANLSF